MASLPLTVTKNRRLSYLLHVRRRIANLNAICDPGVLELNKRSTALERLAEAWQKYESSHQDVLSMVAEDEVAEEQVTFIKMEEAYEAVINDARKIIEGEHRAGDVNRTPQHERPVQLATQGMCLHNQIREILDCVKEVLEKVTESSQNTAQAANEG